MNAAKHERKGAERAHETLDSILSSQHQAHACRSLLGLLNSLSGCSEEAKAARRGAAAVLVNVAQRGLAAISADEAREYPQIAAGNAGEYIDVAIGHLYQSDSIAECRELLAYYLTLIFGDEHEAAAEAVAQHLTTRILRGLEIECVGSVPGNAISKAIGEFQ